MLAAAVSLWQDELNDEKAVGLNDLTPAYVEIQEHSPPLDDPRPDRRPAMRLDPQHRELRVSGWTEATPPDRLEQTLSLDAGKPLAMCWRPAARLAVALHTDDGETVVLGWTWDGQTLQKEQPQRLFFGRVGIITGLAAHPTTGKLYMLDAREGRLFEILDRLESRQLAGDRTPPPLIGRRSLDIILESDPPGSMIFVITSMSPDSDSIDPSEGVLQIVDVDPDDGRIDSWSVYSP